MLGFSTKDPYSGEIAGKIQSMQRSTLVNRDIPVPETFPTPKRRRIPKIPQSADFRLAVYAPQIFLPACEIENVCLRAEMGWNRNVDAKRTVGQLNDVVPCFSFKWSWEAAERKQQLKWDKLNCWNGNILCCLWLLVSCRLACLLSARGTFRAERQIIDAIRDVSGTDD